MVLGIKYHHFYSMLTIKSESFNNFRPEQDKNIFITVGFKLLHRTSNIPMYL